MAKKSRKKSAAEGKKASKTVTKKKSRAAAPKSFMDQVAGVYRAFIDSFKD